MKTILILIALLTAGIINAQSNEKDQLYRTLVYSGEDTYYVYEMDETLFLTKLNLLDKKETILPFFPLHLYYEFLMLKGKGREIAPIKDRRAGLSNPKMFDNYLELNKSTVDQELAVTKKEN